MVVVPLSGEVVRRKVDTSKPIGDRRSSRSSALRGRRLVRKELERVGVELEARNRAPSEVSEDALTVLMAEIAAENGAALTGGRAAAQDRGGDVLAGGKESSRISEVSALSALIGDMEALAAATGEDDALPESADAEAVPVKPARVRAVTSPSTAMAGADGADNGFGNNGRSPSPGPERPLSTPNAAGQELFLDSLIADMEVCVCVCVCVCV